MLFGDKLKQTLVVTRDSSVYSLQLHTRYRVVIFFVHFWSKYVSVC